MRIGIQPCRVLNNRFVFLSLSCSLVIFTLMVSGCVKDKEMETLAAQQSATLQDLNKNVDRINKDLEETRQAKDELTRAQQELEKKLRNELESGDMSVSMQDRGLVVTVLDRVLFDSGKADLKPSSMEALDKLSDILEQKLAEHMIYVEGHTDNVPIRVSGWRSNWELSTTRATEVVHYFADQKGLVPERLAAVGYGQFHPVASNDTPEGRLMNRRVEIVISPKKFAATEHLASA